MHVLVVELIGRKEAKSKVFNCKSKIIMKLVGVLLRGITVKEKLFFLLKQRLS